MISTIVASLALSLALTLALETGFFFSTGKRDRKDAVLVVMVNIITNPVVVLTYWLAFLYTNWNVFAVLIVLEIFAVLTEGYYYRKYGRGFRRPYLFSLGANAFSYGVGVLIQFVFTGNFGY